MIISSIAIVLLSSPYSLKNANGFQITPSTTTRNSQRQYPISTFHRRNNRLFASPNNDDDDDDDDVEIDTLGDWRKFRMTLSETGLPTQSSSSSTSSSTSSSESLNDDSPPPTPPRPRRPHSVSKLNEAILISQNEDLAAEYLAGVWAHDTATAEAGGLVCRMPLEAELYRAKNNHAMGRKLQNRLRLDDDNLDDDDTSPSYDNAPDNDDTFSSSSSSLSFSPLAARTAYWYRGAQSVVRKEMKMLTDETGEDGRIDLNKLSEDSMELLQLYLDYQETWQEVCMVVDRNENGGTATTLVINRPMAMKLTDTLARLVLYGARSDAAAAAAAASSSTSSSRVETEDLVTFLKAFEDECGLYVGGPDMQDSPAMLIHGIKDLDGAVEISPGSGLYKGGLSAAVKGVLAGKYKPLDFRFFIGRHRYTNNELEQKVTLGKYQPVACARALALKQCISLPKPLWHEVMELCGGELKEISSLEMMKRNDIDIEEPSVSSGGGNNNVDDVWDDEDSV